MPHRYHPRHTALAILALLAAITLTALYMRSCREERELASMSIVASTGIDITPAEIRSIEAIGQWEFLAIACEEMVDTIRERTLQRDDRLVRIYTGTLRIGLDMSECEEGWLLAHGDTVSATLPRLRLLSERFIDEARTRSFYESGTWDASAREAMYAKAAHQMRRRALTTDNMRAARENARQQFTALFRTFGFRHVELRFR